MSGSRLSPGGLHLGHYLGCLLPLSEFPVKRLCFFVIRDRPGDSTARSLKWDALIAILADLMATTFGTRILPVLQSSLLPYYRDLVDYTSKLLTVNQLVNVHPRKRQLRAFTSRLSITDLLFPIESACTYFILGAEYVLMNDDNLRFVKFADRLYRKALAAGGFVRPIFPPPQHRHGPMPRIHGFDYRKMAKGNQNCIFLSDSDEVFSEKLSQLTDFRFLFRHSDAVRLQYVQERMQFRLPDEYLPFEYLRAFGSGPYGPEIAHHLREVRSQGELRELLNTVLLDNLIRPIRERGAYYRHHQQELWDVLEFGTKQATRIAARIQKSIRGTLQ